MITIFYLYSIFPYSGMFLYIFIFIFRRSVIRYWLYTVKLIFFCGLFSLSIFRASTSNSSCDSDSSTYNSEDNTPDFEYFLNPKMENGKYSILTIPDYKGKIDFLKKDIYVIYDKEKYIANRLSNIYDDINFSDIKLPANESVSYNLKNDYPKKLKFILATLNCNDFGDYCESTHSSLAFIVYDPNKESNKSELIKFIFDKKNNNCKVVKEINKRLWKRWLWKHISVFLGSLALFTFVGLLFCLFNWDDEDYRNKKRIKKMGTVNGSGRRSKGRSRSKNKNRNIKKRIRMSRRKSVLKKRG